jgi:hypothetical protein
VAGRFALLKQRLLLERLNGTPESETHAVLIYLAEEAASGASLSAYPLLVFPCLFEELADLALEQARRQAQDYWDCRQMPPSAQAA